MTKKFTGQTGQLISFSVVEEHKENTDCTVLKTHIKRGLDLINGIT